MCYLLNSGFVDGNDYKRMFNVKDGDSNKKETAALCQESCQENQNCEAWVWVQTRKDCRLKSFLAMAVEDVRKIINYSPIFLI